MPLILVTAIVVLIVVLLVSFSFIGRRLELFSSKKIDENIHFIPLRWLTYVAVGLTWSLARIHFPGTESLVTYGFDNQVGLVLRAAYWKGRVRELGKDVQIDVGAKATDWHYVSIGDNCWIDRNVILETGLVDNPRAVIYTKKTSSLAREGELRIGKGCHIAKNVVIQACGGVFIGDFTGIASGAKIYSISNHYRNLQYNDKKMYKFSSMSPPEEQYLIKGAVVMEGNNAVGLNSVVLPGVTLGKNSWIGVCSYVVDDIPSDSLASGCPAKVVKTIGSQ